jgi:hypothetical protein
MGCILLRSLPRIRRISSRGLRPHLLGFSSRTIAVPRRNKQIPRFARDDNFYFVCVRFDSLDRRHVRTGVRLAFCYWRQRIRPATIVAVGRPLKVRPSKGELRDLLGDSETR